MFVSIKSAITRLGEIPFFSDARMSNLKAGNAVVLKIETMDRTIFRTKKNLLLNFPCCEFGCGSDLSSALGGTEFPKHGY